MRYGTRALSIIHQTATWGAIEDARHLVFYTAGLYERLAHWYWYWCAALLISVEMCDFSWTMGRDVYSQKDRVAARDGIWSCVASTSVVVIGLWGGVFKACELVRNFVQVLSQICPESLVVKTCEFILIFAQTRSKIRPESIQNR